MTPQDKLGQKQEVSIDEWEDMVRERYQVPRNLWKAMSTQESGGNWDAVSPTGVKGKWQVTEATAKQYGLDRNDPYQQVVAAAKYLRDQYEGLKDVPDDNARWLGAVGRYYGGPGAVGGDGSISTKSPDGVSTPDKHIERVAKLWGQFEKGGEAPAATDFSGKPVTPQPVKQHQEIKFQSPRPPVTAKRGPVMDKPKPLGFGGDPTQQMMQDVAARSKQVKAVPRQPTDFEKRSPLGQAGEILATGAMRGVEGLYKGLSYLNPMPSPYKGKGLLTPEAEHAMQQQEAAQDQAMPLAAPVARGLATAGVQAPAYMLGGAGGMGAGMLTAAGLSAAQEDWSKDPVRSAVRVGINATLPFAASRGANALIRPVTAPGVAATEAIAGAAGNVVPEGIEQMAFEGKLDPQRLAQTGLIGALSPLNVTGAGRQADANKLSRIQKATGSATTAPASETPALTPDQVFGPDDFDPAATAPPPVDPQRPIQSRMQAIGTDAPANSGRYIPTPEVQKGVEVADKARTQAESARANQDAAAEVRSLEGERQAIKAAMRGVGMKDAVGRRALGERLAGIEQDIAKAKANARQSGRSTPEQRPVPETVTPEAARDIADDPTADLTGDLAPLPEQTAPITEDLVQPTGALAQADVATPAIRPQYGRRTGTPVPGEAQRTGPREGRKVTINDREVTLTPEQAREWDAAESEYKDSLGRLADEEQRRLVEPDQAAKRRKALGFRHATRKRQIANALTDKEQSAKDKREASNYKGKSVSINGKNGKVVGNPFGRVKIEFDDGTVATVAPDAVQAATPTADSPAKAPSRWAARENVQGSRGQRSGIPVPSKATDTQPTGALPEQAPADPRSGVATIYGRRAGTPLPPRVGEPAPQRITKEIPRERTMAQESVRTAIEDAKARRKPPAPPKLAGVRPEVLGQKQLEQSGMPIDPTTGQGQTLMYGARPHHQKRLNEQGRAIVTEQQQKVRETAGEADPRYRLSEDDFKGNNYVKLGTDIAGKTAQHLFRTNTKKSLEGISEKGGLGEDLAFFLDPHVQGALGLAKGATSKEAKARLNSELAAIMNIRDAQGNIPEISLRSVPEDVWRMWARRKELPASSMARFNKAVRVARGEITNDTTPPAAPDAAIPQRREAPVRSAQASDTGRPVARAGAETPAASRAVEPVAEPAAARAAETAAEPRAAELVAETYHKGDRARYTGKTEEHYGQTFYEIEILEGHLQGQKFLKDAPMGEVSPNVERQRREFRADQENWRKLREGEKRAAQTEQANPAQSLPPARQQKPKSPSRPKASPKPPSKENKGSAIARAQLNSEERAQLEQAKQYLRDIINDKVEFDTPADRAAAIMNEREKISELQSQLYSDAALRIVEREQGPEAAARARQVSKAEPVAETPQEGAGMSRDESVALAKAERTPATPKPARKAAPQEAASPAKTAPKVNEKTLTDAGWQKKSPADYRHPDGRRISRNERNRWEITRESGEGTQTFDTLRDAIVAATGEPAAKPAKPVKPSPMADDVLIKPQPEMPEDAMPLPPTSKPYNMPDPEPQPQRAAKPAEQAAKEPWQMTREEYRTFDPNGNYDQMIRRAAIVGHISYDDADKLSIIDGMGNKQFWAKTRTELETEKKNAINSGKRERADINKIKADKHFAPWRVRSMSRTAKGHIQHTTDYYDGLLAVHKERVQEALAEGKPVPPEVLADYPDLAPKPATEQPARVEQAKARRAAKPKAEAKQEQPAPEVVKPTPQEQKTVAKAAKGEKISERTGLTKTQEGYLQEKAADAVAQFAEGGTGKPITIKVPGDGQFTVEDIGQANNLHRRLTGQNAPTLPNTSWSGRVSTAKKAPILKSPGLKSNTPPDLLSPTAREEAVEKLVNAYGSREAAARSLRTQMEVYGEDLTGPERVQMDAVLAALDEVPAATPEVKVPTYRRGTPQKAKPKRAPKPKATTQPEAAPAETGSNRPRITENRADFYKAWESAEPLAMNHDVVATVPGLGAFRMDRGQIVKVEDPSSRQAATVRPATKSELQQLDDAIALDTVSVVSRKRLGVFGGQGGSNKRGADDVLFLHSPKGGQWGAETGSLAETQAKRADLKARSPFAKAKAETVADAEAAFKQAQAEFDEAYKPVTELDNDMTRMGQISPKDRRKYGMSNQNRLNPADVYKKYGVKNRAGLVAELERRKSAAKPANDRMVEAYNRLESLKEQGQSDKPRIVTEAEGRLRDSASGKLAGSGAQALADQAIVTGYKVYKQGMAFADWTRSMLREFGGKVRPYLRDTWAKLTAAAKEFYRDEEGSAPASPGPPRRNRVTNAVRENAAKSQPRRSPYADLLEQINQDQLRQQQPAPKAGKTRKDEQPMTRSERFMHNVVSLSGIPRALQATGDFSAPLRQGAILFLPPTQWKRSARAMVDMFASLSPQAHNRLRERIHKSPNIDIAKESGLYLATDEVGSNVITSREEDFISKLAGKIPVAGQIIKASERTYTGFLDSLRMSTFDSYKKTIDKSGGTPEQKAAAYKSAAKWINYATGRGSLGKSFDNAAPLLSTIFFAPRYVASRVNVLNPGTYTAMPRAVAKRALGDLAQYAGMVAMTAYLAKLNGAEVSLDPEDADFLKLKFGETRYDFLAGTQQVMRLFYRTGKDMIESAEGKPAERGKTAIDVTGRFARSKLAPVPSFFMDMVSRKNYIGEPFKADKAVVERVVPLLWKDFYEAYEKEAGLGVLKTSPAVFGAGVQTYKPRTAAPKPLASSTRRRATRRRATRRESIG